MNHPFNGKLVVLTEPPLGDLRFWEPGPRAIRRGPLIGDAHSLPGLLLVYLPGDEYADPRLNRIDALLLDALRQLHSQYRGHAITLVGWLPDRWQRTRAYLLEHKFKVLVPSIMEEWWEEHVSKPYRARRRSPGK